MQIVEFSLFIKQLTLRSSKWMYFCSDELINIFIMYVDGISFEFARNKFSNILHDLFTKVYDSML